MAAAPESAVAMQPDDGRADPDGRFGPGRRVRVLLPLPLAGPYDYRVPPHTQVRAGDYVDVPLGRRRLAGVVWGAADAADGVAEARLRDLAPLGDLPPLPAVVRRFVDWVAAYVMSPPGAVLKMVLAQSDALVPPAPALAVTLAPEADAGGVRETPARRRVLALLADGPPLSPTDLAREAGCTPAVVRGLIAAGLLRTVPLPAREAAPEPPDPDLPGPTLGADQAAAARALCQAVEDGGFAPILLDGVTGSGKTEVYFEAIAAALRSGRQALVLLPEIALSAQWLDRFAARFGVAPAIWHSELTPARRRKTWRAVAGGAAQIVVGARSALFLPYPDLGLIVVDEEHEGAYKQEDGVAYQARDMAVVRAHLGGFPVVLVSATPALETVVNADSGRYRRLHLPARHGGAQLPEIVPLDLRSDPPPRGCFLAPSLVAALARTLAAGEQALLFLNRRGYAPLTLCRACGHRIDCPNCTAWLVEHRASGRLQCHHCGHSIPQPARCPACGAEDSLVACGPGVERIAEEVAEVLPQARPVLMTSDLIHGPDAAQAILDQLAHGTADLIIGTQLVAKGHHFPKLTLVGVVDADLGLDGGDLRAGERTFQLLQQVAGRAGRAARPGRVILQTHAPDHPVIAALAAGDRDGFLAREADARRRYGLPPFGRLAALIVSGVEIGAVDRVCAALARSAPVHPEVTILGPAPAPLALLRNRHRRRFLVKAPRALRLQALIADWLACVQPPREVRVAVDIDPYSFL